MKKHKLTALFLAVAMVFSTACAAQAAGGETRIVLSDARVTVDGKTASTNKTAAVYTGADIIYYKDGTDAAYGEGTAAEKHSAAEAAAHTVVTITRPGTYRLSGSLSRGQVFVDLGENAKDDPAAVVTLILDNVDVTCTVAPAIFFYNVYECDREFVSYGNGENSDYQAAAVVDTTAAGANVILAAGSENNITGSHVARIYKEGTTKKLHKYDGAFYSRMSMNINGDGTDDMGLLNIVADNEGLDSELHLTINGGTIDIESQDDGINTNEDFVSVTTINGGSLCVTGGLGSEGDGIDSNGYLVINGGTLLASANPQTGDGGIDADSPILINGGTVCAFGSRNDAADSSSKQPYMELAFASTLSAGHEITLAEEDGTEILKVNITSRAFQSLTISAPELAMNVPYQLYVDGVLQCWNGNSAGKMGRPGGFGGGQDFAPGWRPDEVGQSPAMPDGQTPPVDGQGRPGPFDGEGEFPRQPKGQEPPSGFGGFGPGQGSSFGGGQTADGSGSTDFTLTAQTKTFSGVCDSDQSGKTRVTFALEGMSRVGRSTVIEFLSAITPSVELDPALVQITVTDDPSENYAATCTLADGLEAVNALLPTDDGDYILTVAVVGGAGDYTGASQFSFTVGALPFVDISEQEESYGAVKVLYKAGVLTGTGENTFSPNMMVTRSQAVTALARLAGAAQSETDAFSDVEKGAWYGGYVAWAVENGIVEGDGQGHFFPDMTVTGEQMALMCARYLEGYQNTTGYAGELTRAQLAQMLMDVMK